VQSIDKISKLYYIHNILSRFRGTTTFECYYRTPASIPFFSTTRRVGGIPIKEKLNPQKDRYLFHSVFPVRENTTFREDC